MNNIKTILITGVAGFIGSNLAERLLGMNCTVIGIDNLSYGLERNVSNIKNHKNFKFIIGDITNPLILKDYKCDVIVHLASQKIPRYTNALKTLDENSIMIHNVINKCLIDKCKIVFASTSDVYGKNPNIPFNENSNLVLGPTNIKRWAYAISKIHSEQLIIANNEQFGLVYTIVRFFGSYGINQNLTWWGGPQSGFITKSINNEPIEIHGDGKQTRTFTYIDDTVDAIIPCIIKTESDNELFNIGSNETDEISIIELAKLTWKLVNGSDSDIKISYIPYSDFGNYEDVMRRVPDITKIKKFFDFTPKWTLEDGLKKTIEWQKSLI